MPQLTKEQIYDTLELRNPVALGDITESMVKVYRDAGHKNFSKEGHMPSFLLRAIGPSLENLPSFTRLYDKSRYSKELAVKNQKTGITGLGEVMETIHSDMRLVGSKVGRLFIPAMRDLNPKNFTGDEFDPAEVQKLKGRDTAQITFDKATPPLTVTYPDLVYSAFMMGAEARTHLDRGEKEKELLKESVGTLKQSYLSLLGLLHIIDTALKKSPDHKGDNLEKFGLSMNTDKIAGAFQRRQKEFSDAYNYMYVITEGYLDPHLEKLKWAIEGQKRPPHGIKVETAKEAAATLSALYELCQDQPNIPRHKELIETISRQTAMEAASTIAKGDLLNELHFLALGKSDENKRKFMQEVLTPLDEFQECYMGMSDLLNKFNAPKQEPRPRTRF